MSKHTPGPWHLKKNGFGKREPELIQVYATNDDLEIICKVYRDKVLHNKIQDFEANARLIAAAPELLEALQQFIHSVEHEGEIHGRIVGAIETAKQAIQKATQEN